MIPKFRAWDKVKKMMVTFSFWNLEVYYLNGYKDRVMVDGVCIDAHISSSYTPEIDVEIMQSTGLHDKNGTVIYEGDILDCGDRIVYVKWHQPCGTWDSEFIKYTDIPLHSNGITPVEWKYRAAIIGNIYEQPELMK